MWIVFSIIGGFVAIVVAALDGLWWLAALGGGMIGFTLGVLFVAYTEIEKAINGGSL